MQPELHINSAGVRTGNYKSWLFLVADFMVQSSNIVGHFDFGQKNAVSSLLESPCKLLFKNKF